MDKMSGMGGLLEQAQKMQADMKQIQKEMEAKTVEATAGGGMVKVVVNGKQRIISIQLDDAVMKMNDKDMLQDLVTAGVNEALKSSQEMVQREMKDKMAGALGPMGSLMNMFS